MNKKLIIVLLTVMAATATVGAHELEGINADGDTLWFNDVSKEYGMNAVEVTYKGNWFGAVGNEYYDTIRIPDNITIKSKSYRVVGIGEQAFAECFTLLSVTIPESIKYIRDKAFQSCCHIKQINYNAVRCADLTLPSFAPFSYSNMAYGAYVYDADGDPQSYWSAYDLQEVNIGVNVERLPDYMFYGMGGGLTQADLSKRPYDIVTSKAGVAHINFLGSPKEIGNQTFRACHLLEEITIPNSVTSVGQALFANCDTLMTVVLPDGIEEIPAYFFSGCKQLANVNLPTSVKSVNYESFKQCAKLENLTLHEGLTTIGPSAFRSCENLKTAALPSTLTTIDGYSFSNCTALTEIVIPEGVSMIGNYAFEDCTNLGKVTLAGNTRLIGNFVFAGCLKLSEGEFHAPAKMPQIQEDTFFGVANTMNVIVPQESQNEYRNDPYWGRFFMPTALENTDAARETSTKRIVNGQLFIEHNGTVYSVSGQMSGK